MADTLSLDQAKYWWLRCISCSEAAVTLVNRHEGREYTGFEQAAHYLSGGFMHQGHACGQLWGATLSAGIRATRRLSDRTAQMTAALHAARRLAAAFTSGEWAFDCRDNIGGSLTSLKGRIRYLRSAAPRACGRSSIAWAAKAHEMIDGALEEVDSEPAPAATRNCAVECMQRILPSTGLDESDAALVAGFAGGLGLSGNVCGVLATGVFALTVPHYLGRGPEQRDSKLRGALQELDLVRGLRKRPARLLSDFRSRFGSDLCRDLTGRHFETTEEYVAFISEGECDAVVEFVASHVVGSLS